MSLASALSILRPTLPSYLALTTYGLLRLTEHSFEFHPHPAAPPMALEMAKAVFTLGASSCIEFYATSQMLAEGPKGFAFDALTCEALENFDLSVSTANFLATVSTFSATGGDLRVLPVAARCPFPERKGRARTSGPCSRPTRLVGT